VANRSGAVLTLNHDSCFVRNGSVTQAWALKVSDLTGASRNRCGSNRYRERLAGAGVGSPGGSPSSGTPRRCGCVWGGINGLLFHQMLHGADIQPLSSRVSGVLLASSSRYPDDRIFGGDQHHA
jgi:hypothetical protein